MISICIFPMTYDVIYLLSGKMDEQAEHKGFEGIEATCVTVMAATCHAVIQTHTVYNGEPCDHVTCNHGVRVVMTVPLWLGVLIMGEVNHMSEQRCRGNLRTILFDINPDLFYEESIKSIAGERGRQDAQWVTATHMGDRSLDPPRLGTGQVGRAAHT